MGCRAWEMTMTTHPSFPQSARSSLRRRVLCLSVTVGLLVLPGLATGTAADGGAADGGGQGDGCTADSDCPGGQACVVADGGTGGYCSTFDGICVDDTDCNVTDVCVDTLCVPATPSSCLADTDCPGSELCDVTSGECYSDAGGEVACVDDADCWAGAHCQGQICVNDGDGGCSTDADCLDDDVCDPGAGVCIAPPIVGSVEVGGDCLDDTDCVETAVCDDSTGLCVDAAGETAGCTADADCSAGARCNTPRGQCQVPPAPGTVDVGGDCLDNADCKENQFCDHGTCAWSDGAVPSGPAHQANGLPPSGAPDGPSPGPVSGALVDHAGCSVSRASATASSSGAGAALLMLALLGLVVARRKHGTARQ
jgi:MYXO-CTERM domain-containing protein